MDRRTRRGGQIMLSQESENEVSAYNKGLLAKRNAENRSPAKQHQKKTRTAFGDITNRENVQGGKKIGTKKVAKLKVRKSEKTTIVVPKAETGCLTNSQQDRSDISWEVIELSQTSSQDSSQDSTSSQNSSQEVELLPVEAVQQEAEPQWVDIDKENENDPYQVSLYASHIFEYYKERELLMAVPDYMPAQKDLSTSMRAILVDWLVEVQENFELNHETLYLAVKLVDHYLSDNQLARLQLQLVGATAMFIACKFDERLPPVLDDFLYICDDAYTRDQLLEMERNMLKSIGFDLGYPLSYRFVRRYAKCGKAPLETLTLARYILEMSLMDYSYVTERDSKMGAATLLMAMTMRQTGSWDATLEHYTGYRAGELLPLVRRLNTMILAAPAKNLATIRTKYSHKVFHEVAKIPALGDAALQALERS